MKFARLALAMILPLALAACTTHAKRNTAYGFEKTSRNYASQKDEFWDDEYGRPEAYGPGYYVTVRRGDTLTAISQRAGYRPEVIARANRMTDPHALYPGQRIWIPGRSTPSTYAQSKPSSTGASYYPAPRPKPVSSDPYWSTRPSAGEGELSSKIAFDWPLKGRVIVGFGVRANGERNDGINIAAAEGDPVRAAADGTVTYAGDELRGYGKLVLIRHPNGYVTAYAHNSRFRVEKGDRVRRGQVIAAVGSTGAVDRPQLHFEIRKGVQPVDPKRYLGATYASD